MILIGLGANLPGPGGKPPEATIRAGFDALDDAGIQVRVRSRLYRSAPVPASDQPWFVNAVVLVDTRLEPAALLAALHRIEARFGRTRRKRWEARILDLDLLAYGSLRQTGRNRARGLIVPHPRLHERAFVLLPLAEIAPDWRHPGTGAALSDMIEALDPEARRSTVPIIAP